MSKCTVITCPGMCNLAQLTQGSAKDYAELIQAGYVKTAGRRAAVSKDVEEAKAETTRWVLVQGCEHRCGERFAEKEAIAVHEIFTVADTGIRRGIHVVYDETDQKNVVEEIHRKVEK